MHELREYAFGLAREHCRRVRCKICGGHSAPFDLLDFNKTATSDKYRCGFSSIPVMYFKCEKCNFIFTDFFDNFEPDWWTTYVYNNEYYAGIDPDYHEVRPRYNVRWLKSLLAGRKDEVIGLDYGGGNGATASLMRAAGWTFDCWDPYGCKDESDTRIGRYNFCSTSEVFEHTTDPLKSLRDILYRCSPDRLMIMLGTGAHDGAVSDETRLTWWYAAPRNGHISLYSRASLRHMADQAELGYVSFSKGTHILTRGYSQREVISLLLGGKLRMKVAALIRR